MADGSQRRHTFLTDADGVIREGWLFKMTPHSMGITKDKFKKRWFMVQATPTGEIITYCKAPDDRETLTKTAPLVRPAPGSLRPVLKLVTIVFATARSRYCAGNCWCCQLMLIDCAVLAEIERSTDCARGVRRRQTQSRNGALRVSD